MGSFALELPPLYDPQPTAALPDDARGLFERACDEWHRRALPRHPEIAPIAAETRDACWILVCSPEPWDDSYRRLLPDKTPSYLFEECAAVRALLEHPSLTPTHIVRLAKLMHGYWSGGHADRFLRAQRRRGPVAYDLRTVALAYARSGMEASYVADNHGSSYKPTFRWERAAVWPYFAEHLPLLDAALGLAEGERNEAWACSVLAMFPLVPQRYHAVLWTFALGKQEPLRSLARRCLGSSAEIVPRVLAVLSNASHEARAAAAAWLGELGDASAIEPLRERARAESHGLTKARCFEALEKLGVAPETLLDRNQLLADAKRVLAKGIPPQLAWLPMDALPKVTWNDGSELPRTLLQGWIVQAFKQKQSASNGYWKVLARQLERAAREHLAWWLLAAWIARDESAQALNEKGLLALVGAFGGSAVEAPIAAYLNEHYGNRKHQCTYLLDVLAWLDLPITTQRLLRVAHSFRTPGIQNHAAALVQQLAERKGWTKQELADRAVPDLGLSERATRELVYSSAQSEQPTRRFKLWLDPDLTLRLEDERQKPLKALPEPKKTESAERAERLAKQLRELRKELKATITLQAQRLFDAMCEQRAWRACDWQECIQRHGVMRRLAARLVWTAGGDTARTSFRLLDDGSLTNLDDDEVQLEDRELVRVAHGDLLDAAAASAWSQHMLDFKVEPLFRQFGRPRFDPDESLLDETSLPIAAGVVTSSLALSRIAAKLGWQRGPIGDGPSFEAYLRKFPGVAVVAELSVSPCSPVLSDEPVTLGNLSFYGGEGAVSDGRLMLRDVPGVLRSECVNDVLEMAAREPQLLAVPAS